jgi:hypothetical protein
MRLAYEVLFGAILLEHVLAGQWLFPPTHDNRELGHAKALVLPYALMSSKGWLALHQSQLPMLQTLAESLPERVRIQLVGVVAMKSTNIATTFGG